MTIAWKPWSIGAESLVVVVRRFHLLEVLGELGELFLGQPARRGAGHLALELAANDDQVVEKRQVDVVFERDPKHERIEQVPGVAGLYGRPAALLDPHEATLFEQLQAFADDRSAEAELLAEGRLGGQHVVDGKVSTNDLPSQLLDHDRGETGRPPGCATFARGARLHAGGTEELGHANIICPYDR